METTLRMTAVKQLVLFFAPQWINPILWQFWHKSSLSVCEFETYCNPCWRPYLSGMFAFKNVDTVEHFVPLYRRSWCRGKGGRAEPATSGYDKIEWKKREGVVQGWKWEEGTFKMNSSLCLYRILMIVVGVKWKIYFHCGCAEINPSPHTLGRSPFWEGKAAPFLLLPVVTQIIGRRMGF